jgi:hypothetical protein
MPGEAPHTASTQADRQRNLFRALRSASTITCGIARRRKTSFVRRAART